MAEAREREREGGGYCGVGGMEGRELWRGWRDGGDGVMAEMEYGKDGGRTGMDGGRERGRERRERKEGIEFWQRRRKGWDRVLAGREELRG